MIEVPRYNTGTPGALACISFGIVISIIALGSEKDWKCQQFLTLAVLLQAKNEVIGNHPNHGGICDE